MRPILACLAHPLNRMAVLPPFIRRMWDNRLVNIIGFQCKECNKPYEVMWI